MNIGILNSKPASSNSSLSRSVLDDGIENRSRLAKFFKKSVVARRMLLFVAMLGTCMVIGDGILTPAISGISLRILSFVYFWQDLFTNFLLTSILLYRQFYQQWME